MRNASIVRLATAGIVTLALTLAGVTARPSAAADAPVDLASLLELSGNATFIGKEALESVKLIVDAANAQGGIRGRQLHLAVQDTTSTPSVAVQLVNDVKARGVAAIFGPTFTADCNAVAPLVASGPVVLCYSPGVHPPPGSFMFSGGVGTDGMSLAITTYFRDKGLTHVALINSTDASGQDFEENFERALALPQNAGLQLVAHEHFAVTDLSVAAQVARIKTAAPQVVIVWTAGLGLGVALHGVHDAGIDVPILAGNANMVRAQLAQYKDILPKTLLFPGILGMAPTTDASAAVRAAQTSYFALYAKDGLKPDLPGALAWDLTKLTLDAYAALGWDATADQLRGWIVSQHDWAGVNGVYDFAKYPQRGIGAGSCVIDRWDPATNDFVALSKPGGNAR